MIVLLLLLVLTGTAAAQSSSSGGPVPRGDFAIGLSDWPSDSFCAGPMSAAMQQVPPKKVLRLIHRAAKCGIRLVLVPPRRLLTVEGTPKGRFSVESAMRLTDDYAAELPPDTLEKYRATILGLNLADDYGCRRCWGGEPITQEEIAEWAAYTRAKLPGVPLGVRVVPGWVARDSALAPLLDYAWAQYHTGKGDAKSYYDEAATTAERLGLRVIMGVNVHDCYGMETDPCSSDDLVRYGKLALSHPASCAFVNWRFDERSWKRSDLRGVWEELAGIARKRGAQECRRAGPAPLRS
jgi:hypothetical protein